MPDTQPNLPAGARKRGFIPWDWVDRQLRTDWWFDASPTVEHMGTNNGE